MRDANLIFHDGTNFTATVTPDSAARSGGSAVLDIGKTGEDGLAVQLALAAVLVGTSPTIDAKIQASDSATFESGVEDLGAWPQLTSSTPLNYRRTLKVWTKRRYMRIVMTVDGTLTTETIYTHVVSGLNRDDQA